MRNTRYKPKTLEWFKERIGKRIYRDADGCDCESCDHVVEHGFEVANENHAYYLEAIDSDYASEGAYLNYRDTKEKR